MVRPRSLHAAMVRPHSLHTATLRCLYTNKKHSCTIHLCFYCLIKNIPYFPCPDYAVFPKRSTWKTMRPSRIAENENAPGPCALPACGRRKRTGSLRPSGLRKVQNAPDTRGLRPAEGHSLHLASAPLPARVGIKKPPKHKISEALYISLIPVGDHPSGKHLSFACSAAD